MTADIPTIVNAVLRALHGSSVSTSLQGKPSSTSLNKVANPGSFDQMSANYTPSSAILLYCLNEFMAYSSSVSKGRVLHESYCLSMCCEYIACIAIFVHVSP